MYEMFSEPFKDEFIVSTILRNNELGCTTTKGARYLEANQLSLYRLVLDRELKQKSYIHFDLYDHTLHPIGIFFNTIRRKTMQFIPRGNMRICTACVAEDFEKVGTGYIHRQHIMPGTLVCHRHTLDLLEVCPTCKIDIKRHRINSLSACINKITDHGSSQHSSDAHKYSKFISDILNHPNISKYRQYTLKTMDQSLSELGYSSSSKTNYIDVFVAADQKIGTGSGAYQKAKRTNTAGAVPLHSLTRVAYVAYETMNNFITAMEKNMLIQIKEAPQQSIG